MTLVIIKRDTLEHEAELIHNDGTQIEICYEHDGKEYYGRADHASLKVHGPRADLWYDLNEQDVTWGIVRDLDNLETWE